MQHAVCPRKAPLTRKGGEREREKEREKERDRERDTHTHSEREREREREDYILKLAGSTLKIPDSLTAAATKPQHPET